MKSIDTAAAELPAVLYSRASLLGGGVSDYDIHHRLSRGVWQRVRAGAYAENSQLEGIYQSERYRLRVAATARVIAPQTVVSYISAAAMYGLPLWRASFERVHVTRQSWSGGCISDGLHRHPAMLAPAEMVLVDGVPVTAPGLTVVDCARMLPFEQGVVIADAALHRGLTSREELSDLVRRSARRKGIGRARAVVAFADGRAESPGESRSRVLFSASGLPPMELQYEIRDEHGILVARVDFAIPELRVAGEFDGRVKYGRLLKPGQSAGDAVFEEKRREDSVRDQNWGMVRWAWDEIDMPSLVASRWQRAIARQRGPGR